MFWRKFPEGQFNFWRDINGNLNCAITIELPKTVSKKYLAGEHRKKPWVFNAEHVVITTKETEEIFEYVESLELSIERILEWIEILKRVAARKR